MGKLLAELSYLQIQSHADGRQL